MPFQRATATSPDGPPAEALDDLVICNGIDGVTGRYAQEPVALVDLANTIREHQSPAETRSTSRGGFSMMGARALNDLGKVGWGVIFPKGLSTRIHEELEPLLNLRRGEAKRLFKSFEFDPAADSVRKWLDDRNVSPGSARPERVPFYLLIVGPPTEIPFEFQYLLDIEYAVGRIDFDTPEEYGAYARSVVESERAGSALVEKEIVYWAPHHARDRATGLSSQYLASPLIDGEAPAKPLARVRGFASTDYRANDATRATLLDVLHRPAGRLPPAMLFTASHGVGWPKDHALQIACQGALLGQEWKLFDPLQPAHYLSAESLGEGARVQGMVAFMFGCFSAGTPAIDGFRKIRGAAPERIAPEPFTSALPKRLLSHPNGAALAVIGHVDRSWGFSIRPAKTTASSRIDPFHFCLDSILGGHRIGFSTTDFNQRYAFLGNELANLLDGSRAPASDEELAWRWIERNDAQNYVVLGDPAARLRVSRLRQV
jgi:hypothetical protein